MPSQGHVSINTNATEASFAAHDAQKEIMRLRLRLVYLDELLAERGMDLDLADEASRHYSDARVFEEEVARLRAELAEARAQLNRGDDTRAALEIRIADAEHTLTERPTTDELADAKTTIAELRAEVDHQHALVAEFKVRLADTEAQLGAAHRDHAVAKDDLAIASRRQLAEVQEALESEMARMRRDRDSLVELVQKRDSELAAARAGHDEVLTDNAVRRREIADLRDQVDTRSTSMERFAADCTTMKTQYEAASSEAAEFRELVVRSLTALARLSARDEDEPAFTVPDAATISSPHAARWLRQLEAEAVTARRDALSHVARDNRSELTRLGNQTLVALETIAGKISMSIQRASNRVDTATSTARRVFRGLEHVRLSTKMAHARAHDISTAVGEATAFVQRLVEEHMRDNTSDVKAAIVNTNVLTMDFIDRIDHVIRRTTERVKIVCDRAEANRMGMRSSSVRSDSPMMTPSPDSDVVMSGSLTSPAAYQSMLLTCNNIVQLLRNNLEQAAEQERRFGVMLKTWQGDITDDLIEFERRVVGALRHSATAGSPVRLSQRSRSPPRPLSPPALTSPLVHMAPPAHHAQGGRSGRS
jgi:myosin heavy subunit